MSQLTREFVATMIGDLKAGKRPNLTLWEFEQLARTWLTAHEPAHRAEQAPRFLAVGYVNTLDGCTSTKYEKGRLPDGERMLYISQDSPQPHHGEGKT